MTEGILTLPTSHAAHPVTHDLAAEFQLFYTDQFASIVAVTMALCGDRGAGEDIAQEAFLRAYHRWDRISGFDKPGAWVRRVAVNLATSRTRKARSETRALLRIGGRRNEDHYYAPLPDDEFWAQVRNLPRRQAQAVALHYVEDLPIDEVAEVMGCSPGSVKTHLSRARAALAERLENERTPHV